MRWSTTIQFMTFVPDINATRKLLSIHTPYVNRIRDGSKHYELRGYDPVVKPGNWCIVYETKPTQHISTVFQATGYWCLGVNTAWERYGDVLGIGFDDYFAYFRDKPFAYGIEIGSVVTFDPIPLSELVAGVGFTPPQGVRNWTYKTIHKRIFDAMDPLIIDF
jgi:predicted transcriptional regulator